MITQNHCCSGRYLRRMSRDDLPAVVEIERGCYPQPWSEAMFERELANDCARLFCCVDNGCVAGYMCIWHIATEVEIHNIATAVAYRRCGIAAFMLQQLHHYLDRYAVNEVFLEVRRGNAAAIALYERFQFQCVSCRRGYYADGEDALLMCWHRTSDQRG